MEHHVYFWLKEEFKNPVGHKRMQKALDALGKSPNITHGTWGQPAGTPARPVTDHTWDYGISFHFATMADHEAYQGSDPIHETFSKENKEMWQRVLVMDLA